MSLRSLALGLGLSSLFFSGCIFTGGDGGSGGSGASSSTTTSSSSTGGSTLGGPCGGIAGLTCNDGELCKFDDQSCGAADQLGICTLEPTECVPTDCGPTADCISEPVCGCDGNTYEDVCHANLAGTDVGPWGACAPTPGEVCGGIAGLACDANEFCDYTLEQLCGAADHTGICKAIPEVCIETDCGETADCISEPVCGCDGQTYADTCHANQAGVAVLHDGSCEPQGAPCGGFVGAVCESGEFCDYPLGAQCGAADQQGTCAPIPQGCPDVYDPVCGCDGNTHGNACEANAQGAAVLHEGPCGTSGKSCGGDTIEVCDPSEFCNYQPGETCGWADALGSCEPIPTVCPDVYAPVCGCDLKDYSNACEANAAGTGVLQDQPCALD